MEARLFDSDSLGSQVTPPVRRESSLMHTVNSNLRQRSEALDRSESIAFFCECQTASCYSPVWLSLADFDFAIAHDAGWLLLDGHVASGLWHRREPLPTRKTARPVRRRQMVFGAEPVAP
jgi:hypothetical protein